MSKRVLITGVASGIGEATAAELRRRGARVVGLDRSGGGETITCDVRDQQAVDSAVAEAVERLGGLDVLINNAGVGTPQSAGKAPDAGAHTVIDVNLMGPWRVTSAALDSLREARGRVVNVSSGLAHLALPFAPAYCMAKAGLVAYSDALRLEHGDAIEVTTVYPGYIRTPIHQESIDAGMGLEGMVPAEPLSSAVDTLVRAALGPHQRDLATTRRGTVNYALLRLLPRALRDRGILAAMRRRARAGDLASSPLAGEFVARLRTR